MESASGMIASNELVSFKNQHKQSIIVAASIVALIFLYAVFIVLFLYSSGGTVLFLRLCPNVGISLRL